MKRVKPAQRAIALTNKILFLLDKLLRRRKLRAAPIPPPTGMQPWRSPSANPFSISMLKIETMVEN